MTCPFKLAAQREFVFSILDAALAANPRDFWMTPEFVDELKREWHEMEVEILARPKTTKRTYVRRRPLSKWKEVELQKKAEKALRVDGYRRSVLQACENARLLDRPTRHITNVTSAAYAMYDMGFKASMVAATLGISVGHGRTLLSYWRSGRAC